MGSWEDRSEQILNDRLEYVIRATVKDLEKRKDKPTERPDTDDYWTKTETLQWVLYVSSL